MKKALCNLKFFIKRLFCAHRNVMLRRWHWVHYPDYEPRSVEIEYKCKDCGELIYEHLYGQDAESWDAGMSWKLEQYSYANNCVCCGEIIPEGRMVCVNCEAKHTP